ncbi:MAG: hypothetical protein MZU91_01765 [Desulfosudis oleivorans]|nr:hypothetical protein [Desulfosudis oleivorans]
MACNQGCIERLSFEMKSATCSFNPECGQEFRPSKPCRGLQKGVGDRRRSGWPFRCPGGLPSGDMPLRSSSRKTPRAGSCAQPASPRTKRASGAGWSGP